MHLSPSQSRIHGIHCTRDTLNYFCVVPSFAIFLTPILSRTFHINAYVGRLPPCGKQPTFQSHLRKKWGNFWGLSKLSVVREFTAQFPGAVQIFKRRQSRTPSCQLSVASFPASCRSSKHQNTKTTHQEVVQISYALYTSWQLESGRAPINTTLHYTPIYLLLCNNTIKCLHRSDQIRI